MGRLFDKMIEPDSLRRGFDQVRENSGCAGTDGQSIDEFAANLDLHIERLQRQLARQTYRPKLLLGLEIPKKDGGRRRLAVPAVRDRVVQTSALLALNPILDPDFSDASYAYRQGRSVQQALARVSALRQLGYRWVVDADIDDYFDQVPHPPLLELLHQAAPDDRLLRLIDLWLKTPVLRQGEVEHPRRGLPQGSPLSPLLSNLYLDRLDDALDQAGHHLVRFADDFLVLCKTRPQAEKALELTEDVLQRLHLRLDPQEEPLTHFDQGFGFLGVEFLHGLAYRPAEAEVDAPDDSPPVRPSDVSEPVERFAPQSDRTRTAMGEALKAALDSKRLQQIASKTKRHRETEGFDLHPLLRTLHLSTQGAELTRRGRRLRILMRDEVLGDVPVLQIDQVVLWGNIGLTTPAIQLCLREDIPIYFLTTRGRWRGVFHSLSGHRTTLQRSQFSAAENDDFRLAVAREIIAGKLRNSRRLLVRRRAHPAMAQAADDLRRLEPKLSSASSVEEMLGLEGSSAARYFQAWKSYLDPVWGFQGRRKRPPTDPVNSLLSYGYTLLYVNAHSLLQTRGLLPSVGFVHSLRRGHAALASDLIEEFRAPVVDSTVLALISRRRISPSDFRQAEVPRTKPCVIGARAKKIFISAVEDAFNRKARHPDIGRRCDYRRALELQCRRIEQSIKDGRPDYRAYRWR